MKELYRKHKRDIWVGVIVSLITTAIIKLGDWFISVVPMVGTSIFETISNMLYSLAATHSDNLLLKILLMGGFSLLVGMSAKSMINGLKLYESTLRLEKTSKKISDERLEEMHEQVVTEREEKNGINSMQSFQELITEGKRLGRNAISLVIITILTYLFIIFFVTTPMSLSNEFEQDVVKIAPYVDEKDITQLKSDWVCMRSKADYDALYKYIDRVKIENDLP